MTMKFLLRTEDDAALQTALVARGWGTFDDVDEAPVTIDVAYPATIDGQDVKVTRQETFLASTIKGWTLPHTVTRSVPVVLNNGASNNRNFDFEVDNLTTFTRDRENWISFTVNGERYSCLDNGGKQFVPASGITLYDFGANGWPLVNKKGVYDGDGNQISAPEVIPGQFSVLKIEDDVDGQAVIDFFADGTKTDYTRTAAQTDWGEDYTVSRYTKAGIDLVDSATLPAQIVAQHGVLRNLTATVTPYPDPEES